MDRWELRHRIYEHFADTGEAPAPATVADWIGDPDRARSQLAELHEHHAVVLDQHGGIAMALPFSGTETAYRVVAGRRHWFANCAWDALAIPIVLDIDATIDARWIDTGAPVELDVVGGALSHVDGFVRFRVPARHWWDDIVET